MQGDEQKDREHTIHLPPCTASHAGPTANQRLLETTEPTPAQAQTHVPGGAEQGEGGYLGGALKIGRCDWDGRVSGAGSISSSSLRVMVGPLSHLTVGKIPLLTGFLYYTFNCACPVSPPARHHTEHFVPSSANPP